MWNQEEIKCTIHNFRLLYEAIINIGTLRWVRNACVCSHLEESLSHPLINDDESVLGQDWFFGVVIETVLLSNDLVKLLELMANDLRSH